jgi:hypothetical protein
MRIVYLALLLLSAVSAQDEVNVTASDSPSDVPSMSPSLASPTATTPTVMPILAQTEVTMVPTAPSSTCDICGSGREVGAVGKGIIFEGKSITCGELQALGEGGLIPIEVCVSVISVFETQDPCSCKAEGQEPPGVTTPTVAPTSSATCVAYSLALASMVGASAMLLLH